MNSDVQSLEVHPQSSVHSGEVGQRSLLRRILRPKFSLFRMFVVVTLLGIGFGVLERFDRSRRVIAMIEGAGGRYEFFPRQSSGQLESWLRGRLPQCYFEKVSVVFLRDTDSDVDEVLPFLTELKSLERLSLINSRVSDNGLAHLSGLKSLKWLFLDNTQIGNAGLEHVSKLNGLVCLSLNGTNVDDSGLETLSSLSSLRILSLERTKIGTTGIKHLSTMKSLHHLKINAKQFGFDERFGVDDLLPE